MVLSAFDLLISKNIHRDVNTFHHDTISHKYAASATDGLRSPSEQFTISRWILQSFIQLLKLCKIHKSTVIKSGVGPPAFTPHTNRNKLHLEADRDPPFQAVRKRVRLTAFTLALMNRTMVYFNQTEQVSCENIFTLCS